MNVFATMKVNNYYYFHPLIICIYCINLCVAASNLEAKQDANDDDNTNFRPVDEFAHLLDRAGPSRRVHLISEIVQDGHQIQVEEFVDLTTYNQLIQFKWHSIDADPSQDAYLVGSDQFYQKKLTTTKVNLLILNENVDRKLMYQYRESPNECKLIELTGELNQFNKSTTTPGLSVNALDWRSFLRSWQPTNKTSGEAPSTTRLQVIDRMVESIKSTAINSPYLMKLQTQDNGLVWLFGVSGLWLRAANDMHPLRHSIDMWQLKLPESNVFVDYYQESSLLGSFKFVKRRREQQREVWSNSKYDLVNFISLNDAIIRETFQQINVVDVDFHYSDRLARNLFKLPIGFGCAQNPLLNQNGLYFREQPSQWMEFELIATKYSPTSSIVYVENELKTIEVAQVRHPLDSSKSLMSVHIREDQTKKVLDLHARLAYLIRLNGTSQSSCTLSHLNDNDEDESTQVAFKSLSLTIALNKRQLNYLLGFDEAEQKQMRLLNVIESSETYYEYVYESQMEDDKLLKAISLVDLIGASIRKKVSVVRVYRQKAVGGGRGAASLGMPKRVRRRGLLELNRVILIVFDEWQRRKLAEIRLNLIAYMQTMSFARRAQKFDLSKCYDLKSESMQLVASYQVNGELVDLIRATASHQDLVERFYATNLNDVNAIDTSHERRLAISSFNYLRAPKVELRIGVDNQLELHVTLLDAIRPLFRFQKLDERTFELVDAGDGDQEVLLVGSLEECSQFCQQLACKTFAYDAKHECKLSHLLISEPSMQSIPKEYSKLFYTLDGLGGDAEATLAELSSYIDHFPAQLLQYQQDDDVDDDDGSGEPTIRRSKRSSSSATKKLPLMSFNFEDRSGLKNEYSPPKTRTLIPSRLSIIRSPLSMDVSGQHVQALKLAESFKAHEYGRCFRLTRPKEKEQSLKLEERSFVDKLNNVYYTFKRLQSIEQQNCALICLNINEWSGKTQRQQVCVSFSHAKFKKECVLLIKTDFDYLQPGETIGEGSIDELSWPEELLAAETGCLLAKRDYLSEFEGPIRLSPDFCGYKATNLIATQIEERLEMDWLQVFHNEAAQVTHLSYTKSDCPAQCLDRSRRGQSICLAFDYCSRVFLNFVGEKRHEVSCNLLLVKRQADDHDAARLVDKRRFASKLNWLRSQLSQLTSSSDENQTDQVKKDDKNNNKSECQRYLLSHLHDFNHLKQRQVSAQLADSMLFGTTSNELNLDSCALECHLQGSSRCLGFQYCLSLEGPANSPQRNCSFIRTSSTGGISGPTEITSNATTSSEDLLTSYNNNCHIYLLNQFNSLNEVVNFRESNATHEEEDSPFGHWPLVICFVVIYASLIAGFVVFQVRRRNSSLRKRMATLSAQFNDESSRQ